MTERFLIGLVVGAFAGAIGLLVYLSYRNRNTGIELPEDLMPKIGAVVGQVVAGLAKLGKRLTTGQVIYIARWTYRYVPSIATLFTENEWIGFMTALLALMTDDGSSGVPDLPEGKSPDTSEIDQILAELRW